MAQPETGPSGFAEEIGVEWLDLDPESVRASAGTHLGLGRRAH